MTDQPPPDDRQPGSGDVVEPPPTDQDVPPGGESLVDYIRANRDRYTEDALRNQLARMGHSTEAVTSAFAEAGAAAGGPLDPGAELPRRARQGALSAVAILVALAAFLIGEFSLLAVSGGRPLVLAYAVLFPIQIVLVTRWIVRRIGASGSLRAGDAAMTLGWFVVPFLSMLALMGVCYGYGAAFGCILSCSSV